MSFLIQHTKFGFCRLDMIALIVLAAVILLAFWRMHNITQEEKELENELSAFAEEIVSNTLTEETGEPEEQAGAEVEEVSEEETEKVTEETEEASDETAEEVTPEEVTEETTEEETEETPEAETEETPEDVPEGESVETTEEENVIETFDAYVVIAYDDEENLSARRPKEESFLKGTFFEVYADGVKMENQPKIVYVPESDGSEHGSADGMEADTYCVKDLPVFGEDGETAVSYTVKLNIEMFAGYVSVENEEAEYALLTDEVLLITAEDESAEAEKIFACQLPAYTAEGTLSWKPADTKTALPVMEEYFADSFKVLRDNEAYTAVRVHYEQDSEEENLWHYSVTGLFTTKEDGTAASYVLSFEVPEGWEASAAEVVVDGTAEEAEIIFTELLENETVIEPKTRTADNALEEGPFVTGTKGTAEFKAEWISDMLSTALPTLPSTLYYKVEGDTEYKVFAAVDSTGTLQLDSAAKDALGITDEQVAGLKVTKTVIQTGYESYMIKGLPDTAKNAEIDFDGNMLTEEIGALSYSFWPEGAVGELLDIIEISGEKYILRKTESGISVTPATEYIAYIDIRAGGQYSLTVTDVVNAFVLKGAGDAQYTFSADGTILDASGQKSINAVWGIADGNLVIENLPEFTDASKVIAWNVSVDADAFSDIKLGANAEDCFYVSYNNTVVTNHGSDRTTCHNGGTLFLNLEGSTVYAAEKIWLDELGELSAEVKAEHRPTTTWYLWRYSDRADADWTKASPVRDENGAQVTWTIDKAENRAEYTTEDYEALSSLPKYDTDGYEYIYFVREKMEDDGDSYEQVFGEVINEDGDVTSDKYPGTSRVKNDKSVYNGGVLSNRRFEGTKVTARKTWRASAHQDIINHVYIEMTLQHSVDGGNTWSDSEYKTYMTGFSAAILTKTHTEEMPQYDVFGKKYQYRWVETGVYEGDPRENPDLENLYDAETGRFELKHNEEHSIKDFEVEYYESSSDGTTTVNRLTGTTSYFIKKVWQGGLTPEEEEIAYAKWTLYQNGEPMPQYTGIVMTAEDNWEAVISDLPKYDASGVEYEYRAVEVECMEGWKWDFSVYNEPITINGVTSSHNASIMNNERVEGIGLEIYVKKEWLDDDDSSCRKEVLVDIIRDAYKGYPEKVVAENVSLSEHNYWLQRVNVSEFIISDTELGTIEEWQAANPGRELTREHLLVGATYSIREVGLGSSEESDGYSEAYSDISLTTQDGDDWNNNRYIGNENHVYYIDYSDNGKKVSETSYDPVLGVNYYGVSNRRVGIVNIDVEKTWVDGVKTGQESDEKGGVTPEERAAYGAELILECVEYPNAISASDPDLVDLHPGESFEGTKNNIVGLDGESVEYVQSIGDELDENAKEYAHFYNLPKYDKDGKVVHYTVSEDSLNDALAANDYTVTIKEEYTSGDKQEVDQQKITVENRRTGSKDIVFYKLWKDEYRYNAKQRPDIYLTVYSASKTYGLEKTDHIDVKWESMGEGSEDSMLVTKSQYYWSGTFQDLPKYNNLGEEIFYFASENMHVDRYSIEYLDTQYQWKDKNFSEIIYNTESGKYEAVTDVKLEDHYYLIDNAGEILLREEGTFINEIQNTINIDGVKSWKNIPPSFDLEHLPVVGINVWRALESDIEANEALYYGANGNALVGEGSAWSHIASIEELRCTSLNTGFKLSYTGTNNADGTPTDDNTDADRLKAFDDNGGHYIYVVTEDLRNLGDVIDGTYQAEPDIDGYRITNVYSPEETRGEIIVGKEWVFPEAWTDQDEIIYPEVTFTLYWRYAIETDADGNVTKWSEPTKVDAVGTTSSKTLNYTKDNTTVCFDNLPLKAPNGGVYEYYVAESVIGGYTQMSQPLARMELKTVEEAIQKIAGENVAVSEALYPEHVQKLSFLAELFANEEEADSKFVNAYVDPQKPFSITGKKIWNDYDNILDTRPDDLTIEVYRKNSECAEELILTATVKNGVASFEVEDVPHANTNELSLVWNIPADAADSNEWTYKIKGLDQYAENGELWQYNIVEVISDAEKDNYYVAAQKESGYITAPTKTVGEEGQEQLADITLTEDEYLINECYTAYTVNKVWAGIYENIEKEPVIVKLQAKKENDTNWSDAEDFFAEIGIAYNIAGDAEPCVQTLAGNSSYTYTWEDLPKGENNNGAFINYEYRAVETSPIYGEDDNFTTETVTGAESTTITNTMKEENQVDLVIEKIWDDNDNQYQIRPVKNGKWVVTFEIWRKAVGSDTEEQVKALDGTSYLTVKLEGEGNSNTGSIRLENLPKTTEDSEGNLVEWIYFAKEVRPSGGILAKSYAAVVTPPAAEAADEYKTTATNTLDTIEVSGTKVWVDDSNSLGMRPEPANVKLTLQMAVVPEAGSTPQWKNAAGTIGYADLQPVWTKNADDTWTWTYSGLPKTNAKGKTLQYRALESRVEGYWNAEYSTDKENGNWIITNRMTEFTLNKIGETPTDTVTDVTLTFTGTKTVADWKLEWKRTAGVESYTIYYKGVEHHTAAAKSGEAVVITGLPVGTYQLTDEAEPNGYETAVNGVNTFTLNVGGTAAVSGSYMVSAVGSKNNSIKITVKNILQTLNINKTDLGGNALAGAVFEVKGQFRATDAELTAENAVKEIGGTEEAIQLKPGDLAAGQEYILTEKKAPAGYRVTDLEIHFKMDENGNVELLTTDTLVSAEADTITVKNEQIPAKLQKVDEEENPLSGAEFEVTGKFVSTPEDTAESTITITDANCAAALTGQLIGGETYEITETAAPDGYKKPAGKAAHFTLTVADDGTLSISACEGAVLNGTVVSVEGDTIYIQDEPIYITLTKLDGDAQKNDKETLSGVKFSLEEKGNEDEEAVQTAVTDEEGKIYLGKEAGENSFKAAVDTVYILTEVETPEGYIIGLPEGGVELTVNADGTVTFTEQEDVITGSDSSEFTVINQRKTGTVVLTKKDSQYTENTSDDTALNGITFSLYRKEDGSWLDEFIGFITGKNYVLTDSFVWNDESTYPAGVKSQDGHLIISGLPWGDYKIVESKADGYILDKSEHTFSIGPDHEYNQYFEVSLGEIINDPNYVLVRKVDSKYNEILAGAEFTLVDAAGKRVDKIHWNWDSEAGEGRAYRLAAGLYTLIEVKAPDKYLKLDPVQFEMKTDGTIRLVGEYELAKLMTGSEVGIILKNRLAPVTVAEEDTDDVSDSTGMLGSTAAKTGDSAQTMTWILIMAAALAVMITVIFARRRKK